MKTLKTNIQNYFNSETYSEIIENVAKHASNLFQLSDFEINVVFVSNERIQKLNNKYRNKDYATDVLTFPNGENHQLGDVIISIEKCEEQANTYNHSFNRELGFLFVHGLLHTLGYDHQTKEEEEEMTTLQERVLQKAKLFR